jgi:tRNA G46 methylase TrmB
LTYHFSVEDSINLSFQERAAKALDSHALTYGELTFATLAVVLRWVARTSDLPERGGTFVDLGHGNGKGLLAAALMHPFERVVGIEYLEDLHKVSEKLKGEYDDLIKPENAPEFDVY